MLKRAEAKFSTVLATIGAILIGLGFAWLLAQNWHQIPSVIKIIVLLGLTAGSFFTGVKLEDNKHFGIAGALYALGSLLYTLSIFLIAQIFSTDSSVQGFAFLLLLSWVGVIIAAYIFRSRTSLVIGLLEFIIWILLQYLAFAEQSYEFSLGLLVVYFLTTGVLFYGLGLYHRANKHPFSGTYTYSTALYFLIFAYLLSFQSGLPEMWTGDASMPAIVLLGVVIVAAVFALVSGILALGGKYSRTEMLGFAGLVALLLLVLLSTVAVRGEESYWLFYTGNISVSLWLVWIFANIVFIATILAVIGFGITARTPGLVNLGMVFFGLFVITRYIGFMIDLGGYTSFAVILITGGIILIFGGWGLEKWRRSLVAKAQ